MRLKFPKPALTRKARRGERFRYEPYGRWPETVIFLGEYWLRRGDDVGHFYHNYYVKMINGRGRIDIIDSSSFWYDAKKI